MGRGELKCRRRGRVPFFQRPFWAVPEATWVGQMVAHTGRSYTDRTAVCS